MSRLLLMLAALLVSASLGATPPPVDYETEDAAVSELDGESAAVEPRSRRKAEPVPRQVYTKTRYVPVRHYRKAYYHRRGYVHQRFVRNAGPFYRKNLRRPPTRQPEEDDYDDELRDD